MTLGICSATGMIIPAEHCENCSLLKKHKNHWLCGWEKKDISEKDAVIANEMLIAIKQGLNR